MSLRNATEGRPDFSSSVYESAVSTLFSPRQAEWDYLWENDSLPPKKTTANTVYTVPTGYRLMLKGAMVSASKEGMHRVWICSTPGIVGDCRFLYFEALTFPPSSEITAGSTLTIYLKNNSTRVMRGTVSFIGILEKL